MGPSHSQERNTAEQELIGKNPADAPTDEASSEYEADIRRFHINDSASVIKHSLVTVLFLALVPLAIWTWSIGWWPLTVVVWCVMGFVGHSKLISLHEASHGTLHPNPILNEIQGLYVGVLSIVLPLSAYRYVHGQHHAYVCSERDLELWPFVNPGTPRWARWLAVVGELIFGLIQTPILFLHGVLVGDNLPRKQKIRIWTEYAVNVVVWGIAFVIISYQGWWTEFVVGWLVPFAIIANIQSLRKFTEHLGILDSTPLGGSRTVVDDRLLGRALSASLLHIDYHGTHHRYGKIPYYHLPDATPVVYGKTEASAAAPVFSSYWSAMRDMFRTLGNPRVGSQWLQAAQPVAAGADPPKTVETPS